MASNVLPRLNDGRLQECAWPGGYPILYIMQDGGILCPTCARMAEADREQHPADDPQWAIIGADCNYETPDMICDHCYKTIDAAYV